MLSCVRNGVRDGVRGASLCNKLTLQHSKQRHLTTSPEVIDAAIKTLPDLTLFYPMHIYPSHMCSTLLDVVQHYSALPWWSIFLIAGVATKAITLLPIHISMLKQTQFTVKSIPKQAFGFVETYFNNLLTKGEKHAYKMAWNERRFIVFRNNVMLTLMHGHLPYLPFLGLYIPTISMLWGVNYLLTLPYLPMLSGGMLTFTNLTTTDPILPLVTALTLALHIKHHGLMWSLPLPPIRATPALLLPFLGSLFILSHVPAAFHLYFIGSNLTGAAIGALLNVQSVRELLNLQEGHEVFDRVTPQYLVFNVLGSNMERNRKLLIQRAKAKQLTESQTNKHIVDGTTFDTSQVQIDDNPSFTKVIPPTPEPAEQVMLSKKTKKLEQQ